jgi:hypothetical protein
MRESLFVETLTHLQTPVVTETGLGERRVVCVCVSAVESVP